MGISKTAGTKQYTEKDELWYARQSGNILQSFIEFLKLSILPRRPSELNAKIYCLSVVKGYRTTNRLLS